jgi:tRNA threonylcarbamoyladenosine biosynthesis protein TsaE
MVTTMDLEKWYAKDVHELEACAFALAQRMSEPTMIALIGNMGAGKTHFSKGFARGLGFQGEVTSPTFSIVQEYHGGRMPIFHFDWYRIKEAEELAALGWDEYLDQSGIVLVEWADLFPQLWPETIQVVQIELSGEGRTITYTH